MANFFPLIANTSAAQIQEIPSGDFLDLSESGIANCGNITVDGVISATGNISGGNLSGTSIVGTLTTAAQTNITSVGTLTALTVTGNVSGGNLTTAGLVSAGTTITATGNVSGGNLTTAGQVTATGNISGGNLNVTGNIVDSAALEIITGSNGNITLSPNGSGVIVASKDIRNGQANGTGNIGASGAVFNTVFAKATSAQYADLAEIYLADQPYEPGTVLEIGGTAEVTATRTFASPRTAGVVSTDPAYVMNAGLTHTNAVKVALIGRVPCCVVGQISKGDLLTSSSIAGHAMALDAARYVPGCVIGKALEDHESDGTGIIEIMVGRL